MKIVDMHVLCVVVFSYFSETKQNAMIRLKKVSCTQSSFR